MNRRSKLVALTLAVMLLALEATALSPCLLHMPATKKDVPHCHMMSAHASPVSVQEAPARASCCDMSAGKPTPVSLPPVPNDSVIGVAPTLTVSALDVPLITVAVEPTEPSARASGSAPQALLCTFLI